MPSEEVTIYTVAAEAGVSISTVSLTLNRPARVKASTRKHVLEVIDRLGFVPHAAAVSQARRAIARVGVIAPFSSYESYQRRLVGILTESAEESTDIVVFDQLSAAESSRPLMDSLPLTNRLDGLIIMGLPLDDNFAQRLRQRKIPTVLIDSDTPHFSSVTVDDHRGGILAGQRLLERDPARFAWVREQQRSAEYRSAAKLRGEGFQSALRAAGREDQMVTIEVANGLDGGREALHALRADAGRPVGVFAHHDTLAAGLLLECRTLGLRVPQDVAIVGFDDGPLAEALAITTIRQPFDASGRAATRMLQQLLADPATPIQHTVLDLSLIPRTSG
jgi:DNA-binding LacI/PurR family transcriptional regulator